MVSKVERKRILEDGGPVAKFSLSQKYLKFSHESEEREFGRSKKEIRSERRKLREKSREDIKDMTTLWILGDMIEGEMVTNEAINFTSEQITENGSRLGRLVDSYGTERGIEVSVTIVDFNHSSRV